MNRTFRTYIIRLKSLHSFTDFLLYWVSASTPLVWSSLSHFPLNFSLQDSLFIYLPVLMVQVASWVGGQSWTWSYDKISIEFGNFYLITFYKCTATGIPWFSLGLHLDPHKSTKSILVPFTSLKKPTFNASYQEDISKSNKVHYRQYYTYKTRENIT